MIDYFKRSLFGRILFSLALGCLLAFVLSESAFLVVKNNLDRDPQRIELVIPAGTAERVAAGQAVPALPKEMNFVVGDVLVVINQDSASHQLGPTFVPPGASATLNLNEANEYSYACSFQPTRNLGVDVRPRVTAFTRFQAIFLAGPPMAALILLYSLVMVPLTPRKKPERA
ncbi:MAG: hypothetical protein HY868_00260 [Chloroflexi bacterium]|nr:hypothetical protein [Chloroflexota bacterium]